MAADSSATSGVDPNRAAAASVVLSTTVSSSFGNPLSTVLTVKLGEKNYLLWRGMVLAILRGQRIEGYVLGTKPRPADTVKVVTEQGETVCPNPELDTWVAVDQALAGWLFGSMTPTVAADVVSFATSQEIWVALEKHFGATSKARVNQLRAVLQNTKKGVMKNDGISCCDETSF